MELLGRAIFVVAIFVVLMASSHALVGAIARWQGLIP